MKDYNTTIIRNHLWPTIAIIITLYSLCAMLLYVFKLYFGWFVLAVYGTYEYKKIVKINFIQGISTPHPNKYYLINMHGEAENATLAQPCFIGTYFSVITLNDWKHTIATLCIIRHYAGNRPYVTFIQHVRTYLCNKV